MATKIFVPIKPQFGAPVHDPNRKPPKTPEEVAEERRVEEGTERAEQVNQREERQERSRSATLLTGARGLQDDEELTITRRTLLGA